MKAFVMTLALLAGLQSAHADQTPAGDVLAELGTGGSMPVPGGLTYRNITVTKTGEVKVDKRYYQKSFDNPNDQMTTDAYVLPALAASDLALLNKAVANIKGGKLTKPHEPLCVDAGGAEYKVQKGTTDKTMITVFENFGCQDQQLVDRKQRPAALVVKKILDTLENEAREHNRSNKPVDNSQD